MNLLALDTSSVACSVALRLETGIFERHEEQAREHTKLLVPMIRSLLVEAKLSTTDLDAVVLGIGPGSFIGVRIGTALAQGIAFGVELPVVPVSSLAAIAAQVFAEQDAAAVVVAQDAHLREVYLGYYARGPDDLPVAIFAERLHDQEPIAELEDSGEGERVAAGCGWHQYPELFAANRDRVSHITDVLHPRARYLLALGSKKIDRNETVMPRDVVPAYLRQKVAAKPGGAS